MKAEDQILFRKYLAGELSSDELSAFEGRLSAEARFSQDFNLYKEMEGFVGEQVEKGAAMDVLREVGKEERGDTKSGVSSKVEGEGIVEKEMVVGRRRWIWLVLGLGMLGIAAYFLIGFEDNETLQYVDVYVEPNWPVERSGDGSEISEAVAEYLSGNIDVATKTLKEINTSESNYWLAEIYAKKMVGDSVLKYLPLQHNDKLIKDRARYLKIITLMNLGYKQELKKAINSASDLDGFYLKKIKLIESRHLD